MVRGSLGRRLVAATAMGLMLTGASSASAATRLVATTGTNAGTCTTSPCKTITYALGQSAATGDVINVAAGTYPEAVSVSAKEVTINGAGQASTTINAGGTAAAAKSPLTVAPGVGKVVTVSGVTLTGGYQPSFAGGVSILNGELRLNDSTVTGNTGGFGGGIGVFTNFNGSPKLTASNITVKSNTASVVGGGVFGSGALSITGSLIDANTAPQTQPAAGTPQYSSGGGVFVFKTLAGDTPTATLANTTVSNNKAYYGGGVTVLGGSTLTLSGTTALTKNAATANGGGAYVSGTATLNGTGLDQNTAGFEGGGLFAGSLAPADAPVATLMGASLTQNTALIGGGGAVEKNATAHVAGGTFDANVGPGGGGLFVNTGGSAALSGGAELKNGRSGGGNGGGIWNAGTLALDGVKLTGNLATANAQNQNGLGGGLYTSTTTTTAKNVAFSGNTAAGGGGAAVATTGALDLRDSTFSGDTGTVFGGGLFAVGDATVANTTFTGERAGFAGGAVEVVQLAASDTPSATLTDSPIADSSAATAGGGVAVGKAGTVTLTRSDITGGKAVSGGALWVQEGATASLDRSDLTTNRADGGNGGAIIRGGTVTVADSEISGNTATPTSGNANTGFGGAVYSASTPAPTGVHLTLDRVTAAQNTAVGGSALLATNQTTVRDSTIADNTSTGTAGALYTAGAVLVRSSTVHGNAVGSGGAGGLANAGGTVAVAGSIVAGNGTRSCAGAIADGGYNLGDAGDPNCGFTAAAHDVSGAPKLEGLADNGGPTRTKAPMPSSPALEKIPPATTAGTDPVSGQPVVLCADGVTDQRGVARPQGPKCDIGSVEIAVSAATISGPDDLRMITGRASSATYTATGVPTPAFSVTGTLPAGVKLTDAGNGTATLGGTPAAGSAGTYHVTVVAANGVGPDATQDVTILVVDPLVITTTSLPGGTVAVPYSATLAATGGVPPYTWTVSSGALPAGLTLGSDGKITGTPTGPAGTTIFTIRVQDAETGDRQLAATKQLSITIGKAATKLTADPAAVKLLPTLKVTIGQVTAHLTTAEGTPVAGEPITFTAGTITLCTATTDSTGTASCPPLTLNATLATLLTLGYYATYDGSPSYEAARARGQLVAG
jgi:hypothetical protein